MKLTQSGLKFKLRYAYKI